jgi:hypothetical protein
MKQFYLGTNAPSWLWDNSFKNHKLFISTRRLQRQATYKPAKIGWSLDSGGFTELNMYGQWETPPQDYVVHIRRYQNEIGLLEWASQQDWMCETFVLQRTGKTIEQHQQLTTDNLLELRHIASDLPIIPVLQGWTVSDYLRHAEQFEQAGINLANEPTVGIGSVCRRAKTTEIAELITELYAHGIKLHGFGIKTDGIKKYGFALQSADSMAWSQTASWERENLCGTKHKSINCRSCPVWAQMWADNVVASTDTSSYQQALL